MGHDSSGTSIRMKKRDACDKCHEMKSKCDKAPGSNSCIRCERSGCHCHFSEALRSGRPKKRASGVIRQDSMTWELEGSKSADDVSPLEPLASDSNIALDDELDMLDFTGPLQDLFTTPHTLDGHFQALGATDTTLESLLSATPNDPQIIHLSNHSTALSDEPLQIERNEDRVSKRLREDRCLTVPSPPETDSGDNQNSDKYNSTSQRDPIQRLLGLQSTLQKIPKPCTDERAQKSDGTWTPQTAIEEAFIATDKLVSVIEEINDQASYDTSWNANFPYRNNSNTDAERSRLRPPGEESTSLLVLSCYVCLLEIYQVQIVSMCDEAEDTVYGPGKNTGRRRSNPPARASTFSSSPTNIPVLNIGQFNLGMSPVRNIGLLLYVTQDMVGRLQSVVQHCVSSNNEIETYSFMHTRNDSHPRAGQPVFRTRRMDIETGRIQDGGTVRAMSFMFDSILKGIEARETQLKASIQEVKNILNNSS